MLGVGEQDGEGVKEEGVRRNASCRRKGWGTKFWRGLIDACASTAVFLYLLVYSVCFLITYCTWYKSVAKQGRLFFTITPSTVPVGTRGTRGYPGTRVPRYLKFRSICDRVATWYCH
eukprot:933854-Rhodomonas_salina.1